MNKYSHLYETNSCIILFLVTSVKQLLLKTGSLDNAIWEFLLA